MKLNFQNTSRRVIRIIFSVIFIIIIVITGINLVNVLYINAISNDQCAWREIPGRQNAYLITDVVEGGVADKAGIKNGDILLKINGESIDSKTRKAIDLVNNIPYGGIADYVIERDGSQFNVDVVIIKVFDTIFLANYLFGLVFIIVGYLVVMTRPEGLMQRYFAYFGILLLLNGDNFQILTRYLPLWSGIIFYGITSMLFPFVFINFCYLFPVRRNRKHLKKIIYVLITLSIISSVYNASTALYNPNVDWTKLITGNVGLITFITGMIIFFQSYFKYLDKQQRKPLKPIFITSFISLLAILYVVYFRFTNNYAIFVRPVILLPGLLIIALPLAYGYSIFKYRLMDSHFIIKKSLIYGIISTGVAIIYIFLVFGVGDLLKSAFGNNESEALSIFALVVIAFMFDPLKKRIQNVVDRIFYRERYDYQKTLLNFSKILPLKMNVNQIMNSVVNTISTSMHIDKIAGVILDEKNQYKCFSKNIPDELCMYSEEPHGLLNFLNIKKQTINLNEFIDQKSYYTLSDEEITKITKSGVQLIIPMIANDKVIGFINSGPKLYEKVY